MVVLTIQVGQCGNQLGSALFNYLAGELAAANPWTGSSYAGGVWRSFFNSSEYPYLDDLRKERDRSFDSLFKECPALLLAARAVLVDTEAKVLDRCCGTSYYPRHNDIYGLENVYKGGGAGGMGSSSRHATLKNNTDPAPASGAASAAVIVDKKSGLTNVAASLEASESSARGGVVHDSPFSEGATTSRSNTSENLMDVYVQKPESNTRLLHYASRSQPCEGWIPWCYDPKSCVFGGDGGGCSNNFAQGYLVEGRKLREPILEALRRDFESMLCRPDTILLLMSLAGGTGSGIGPHIAELCEDYFSGRWSPPLINVVAVWPFTCGELSVQSYNACLSLAKLNDVADAIYIMENTRYDSLLKSRSSQYGHVGDDRPAPFFRLNSAMATALSTCALLPISHTSLEMQVEQQQRVDSGSLLQQQPSSQIHRQTSHVFEESHSGSAGTCDCYRTLTSTEAHDISSLHYTRGQQREPKNQLLLATPIRCTRGERHPLQHIAESLCSHPGYKLLTCRVLPKELLLNAAATPITYIPPAFPESSSSSSTSTNEGETAATLTTANGRLSEVVPSCPVEQSWCGSFASYPLPWHIRSARVGGRIVGRLYGKRSPAVLRETLSYPSETYKGLLRRLERMLAARSIDAESADPTFDLERRREAAVAAADARCSASARAVAAASAAAGAVHTTAASLSCSVARGSACTDAAVSPSTVPFSSTADDFSGVTTTSFCSSYSSKDALTQTANPAHIMETGKTTREQQQEQRQHHQHGEHSSPKEKNVILGCYTVLRGSDLEYQGPTGSRQKTTGETVCEACGRNRRHHPALDMVAHGLSSKLNFWANSGTPVTVIADKSYPSGWRNTETDPRGLCTVSNCQTPLPALQEVLRRVKRMVACRAYVHHYEEYGLRLDEILRYIGDYEEVVTRYETMKPI